MTELLTSNQQLQLRIARLRLAIQSIGLFHADMNIPRQCQEVLDDDERASTAPLISNQQLRAALSAVSLWLRAALDYKQWVWDSDQRLAAMGCLAEADECLKSPVETQAKPAWIREVGWVVENGESGEKLRYRTMEHGAVTWTADNLKALRFARRDDAEMFSREDEGAWLIAEHIWSGPPQHSCGDPKCPRIADPSRACTALSFPVNP